MGVIAHKQLLFISWFLFSIMTITSCQKTDQKASVQDSNTIELIQKAETFNDLFNADTISLKFPTNLSIGGISAINILSNNNIIRLC